jgi:hypothetical protein
MAMIKEKVFSDAPESIIKKLKSEISTDSSAFKFVKQFIQLLQSIHKQKKKERIVTVSELNRLLDKVSEFAKLPKLKKQINDAHRARRYASSKTKVTLSQNTAKEMKKVAEIFLGKNNISYELAVRTLLEISAKKITEIESFESSSNLKNDEELIKYVDKLPNKLKGEVEIVPPGFFKENYDI